MSKIKVGVIGVGRMGKYHVGILSELPEVDLTAVVDIDSKSRKVIEENYGTCLLYTSPSPRDRSLSRMPSSA